MIEPGQEMKSGLFAGLYMRIYIKPYAKVLAAIVLIISLLLAGSLAGKGNLRHAAAAGNSGDAVFSTVMANNESFNVDYFRAVMDYIKEYFNDGATDEQLVVGALRGLFGSLDQYSEFYTNEEADYFFDDVGGEYGGIGISMLKIGEYIQVTQVFPDTPAEKAGIITGDRIVSVDGTDITGLEAEFAALLIRGEEGTQVELGIVKASQTDMSKVVIVTIVREIVKINPVLYEIREDIAYIKIETFNLNTYDYFVDALGYIDNYGIRKIVLDLRNNPGGYVDQAVAVARSFVPEGLITKLDFKSADMIDIEYHSELKLLKYNVSVLVNSGTASASEILAGAMQDSKSGILVGTQTYGKAKIQSMIPILTPSAYSFYKAYLGVDVLNAYDLIYSYDIMPYDSELIGWTKMTTGEYLTPLGRKIGNIGLIPYMWIDDPEPVNGVDIGSVRRLQKTVKPDLGYVGPDVYNAEKILRIAGYNVDEPDMTMDGKTVEAVRLLQADKDLYPHGILDFTTQQAINDLYDELLPKCDYQYYWALKLLE